MASTTAGRVKIQSVDKTEQSHKIETAMIVISNEDALKQKKSLSASEQRVVVLIHVVSVQLVQ